MVKNFRLIGVFCMGLMAFWITEANAAFRILGFPTASPGSVIIDSKYKAVGGNLQNDPSFVKTTIFPIKVIIYYSNPADKLGGIGVPFTADLSVSDTATFTPTSATKNGQWNLNQVFDDSDFLAMFGAQFLADNAPNPQWTPTGKVDVLRFGLILQGFHDVNSYCPTTDDACYWYIDAFNSLIYSTEEEVIHYEGECELSADGLDYNCQNNLLWEYSNNDQFCDNNNACQYPIPPIP